MKKLSGFLLGCMVAVPFGAQAAGTYYNGTYQSPQQQRYAQQPYGQTGYYNRGGYAGQSTSYNSTRGVTANPNVAYTVRNNQNVGRTNQVNNTAANRGANTAAQPTSEKGFWMDAGLTHEFASWKFEMHESGSQLHYDNLAWNVLDVRLGYGFGAGGMKIQLDGGIKYGVQSGDSTMVDDDATNGGYFITQWIDGDSNAVIGEQIGHALSVGATDGGSMFGMHVGVGLQDFFKWGNVRLTPSVGYRYFKYKLETKNTHGLSIDTLGCFVVDGETQCDPVLVITYGDGTTHILTRDNLNSYFQVAGSGSLSTEGTYYYEQPGTSHQYEVLWQGPYLALDLDYLINQNNTVNARLELGLPGYEATGDQPYRFDWAHPKSVKDKADMGSAFHLGLGANWTTALTNSVSLSVGLTYDYYTVSDADATTYLNGGFYSDLYNSILAQWLGESKTEADMLNPQTGDGIAISIKELEAECPGWVCTTNSEIDSIYSAMGIRVGINAKF